MLYQPILPESGDEDALAVVEAGDIPKLHELRLHQGSIWLWNRPVYDPGAGGHLRIELRALPAGPTIVDMLANAALAIGLARLMQSQIRTLLPAIPFTYCTANFYRAAQKGLNADIFWPSLKQTQPEYFPVSDIVARLLPHLPEQLASMGFIETDFNHVLAVIAERLDTRQTGAQWQLKKLAELRSSMHKRDALVSLFTHRMIVTDISLGALMEISDAMIPTATIECGGSQDAESNLMAVDGLIKYWTYEDVLSNEHTDMSLEFLQNSMRLELLESSDIAYGDHSQMECGATRLPDIEKHNFGYVGSGDRLGFIAGILFENLKVSDPNGNEAIEDYFEVREGVLFPKRRLKFFMVKANPEIARKDCLLHLPLAD